MSSRAKDQQQKKNRRQHKEWRTKALDWIGFVSMAKLAKAAGVYEGDLSGISRGTRKPCNAVAEKIICAVHERNYDKGWVYMDAAVRFQEAFNFLRNHFATEANTEVVPLSDSDVERWCRNYIYKLNQLQQGFEDPLSVAACHVSVEDSLAHLIKFLKSWEMKHDFGYLGKVKQAFSASRSLLIRPAVVKGMQAESYYEQIRAIYTEVRHIAHLCGASELVTEMSEWLVSRAIARGDTQTEIQVKVTQAWIMTSQNEPRSLLAAQKLMQNVTQLIHTTDFLKVVAVEHMDIVAMFAELQPRLAIRLDSMRDRPLGKEKFEALVATSKLLLIEPPCYGQLTLRMRTRYSIPLDYQHGVYLYRLQDYEGAKVLFESIAKAASYIGWTRVEQAAYSWLAAIFEALGDKASCVAALDKINALYLEKRQMISQHIRFRITDDE